jgi:hypothetical protein
MYTFYCLEAWRGDQRVFNPGTRISPLRGKLKTGANPTIASYNASVVNFYNASVVNFYNATGSLVHFININMFFFY